MALAYGQRMRTARRAECRDTDIPMQTQRKGENRLTVLRPRLGLCGTARKVGSCKRSRAQLLEGYCYGTAQIELSTQSFAWLLRLFYITPPPTYHIISYNFALEMNA